MDREVLLDKGVNGRIPLPVFQTALVIAGGVTQIMVGIKPSVRQLLEYKIPGIRTTGATANNFNESLGITPKLSNYTLELIQGFKHGIILATHDNGNMSDFSAPVSLLDALVHKNLRIGTGKTVTPMYGAILSDAEAFLAEGETKAVIGGIKETIRTVNEQSKVALLPYFGGLQALHKKILKGVASETPVLNITSTFPFPIKYVNGKDGWFGEDTIYGRTLRGYDPIQVEVNATLRTAGDYSK